MKSERLILRSLKLKDADDVQQLRSDARVNKFLQRPHTINVKQAKEFIKLIQNNVANGKSLYWAITHNQEFIGTICLWNLDIENDIAELGYELKFEAQGKGFMSEAVKAVIDFAFKKMCVKTITAFPKQGNFKSIQLLKKNNFVLDNTFKFASEQDIAGYWAYYLSS